ncbi:MAG: Sec-independent protein translocase TatA [Hellea sp.]|nr:Sec-independent protein translocase TatA [Hellea sp.]
MAVGVVGPWQALVVIALIIILFGGKGRISSIMGDMAKGITSFRKGLKDDVSDSADAAEDAIDVTPKEKSKQKK